MKRIYCILSLIATLFIVWSCEKTEINLNAKGDPATITGTWKSDNNFIQVTSYLQKGLGPDYVYKDTTVVDSTKLVFTFGAVKIDDAAVTAIKILNKKDQAPVNLAVGSWSFAIATSTGSEISGSNYFTIYEAAFPHNYDKGYGTTYTYKLLNPGSMEIGWVVTSSSIMSTKRFKAVLNKQ
jgi:hypothetical protein